MTKQRKLMVLGAVAAACLLGAWWAGWFVPDGSTYEECMEARRNEIQNVDQHEIADVYCRAKHPAFDPSMLGPAKR